MNEGANVTLKKEILFGVCALAYAVDVAACIMWSNMGDVCFTMLKRQMAGIEVTPLQYRMLVAWLFQLLHVGKELRAPCIFVSTVAILSYLYTSRACVFHLFGENEKSYALSFVFWLLLPVLYIVPLVQYCWMYDLVGLAFISLGLLLILKKQMAAFLVMFAVATFNRETTCFLTLYYLVLELRRHNWKKVLGFCAIQGVIWFGIKIFLNIHYADRTVDDITGGTARFNFFHLVLVTNIKVLTGTCDSVMPGSTARAWLQLAAIFGGLWIPVVMFWKRVNANQTVKRMMWVVPVYITGMFSVGAIDELRIFAELGPVIGLAYCAIIITEKEDLRSV